MTSISPHTTRANGTILSATIYNSDHTNHVANAQALNAGKVEGVTPPVVDGEGMVFDGTSGTSIRSLGAPPVVGPVVAVDGNIPTFDGTTGALLEDSGIPAAHLGFGTRTDIASAGTTSLATITSHHANVTGTTTITSFGTSGSAARPVYLVRFNAALTLTHNATSLILPGGADITTAEGDYALVVDAGSNNWRVIDYAKNSPAATDTAPGIAELAVQSELETATDVARIVTPGRQHFHPAHPKMWGHVTVSGGPPTISTSHNLTSITDTAEGILTATIATDFSSANWCPGMTPEHNGVDVDTLGAIDDGGIAAGTVRFLAWQTGQSASPSLVDPLSWNFWGFGDQA